jgi:hypothetical protein
VNDGSYTINGVLVKVGEWVWISDVTGRTSNSPSAGRTPNSPFIHRFLVKVIQDGDRFGLGKVGRLASMFGSRVGEIGGIVDPDNDDAFEADFHPAALYEDCYRGTWKASA